MPRIRTIKPEFWTDDKIVELSSWARLLYIGLWNFADDNGVLEYKVKQIKMRIFPADDLDINPLLEELEKKSLIQVYEVDDKKYLICPNLAKHQVIDKPRKSNLPLPENMEVSRNQLKSTEIMLGREGKGRGKGKEKKENLTKEKPKKDNGYSQDFEIFWQTKKKRPDDRKADAWREWKRLDKSKDLLPPAEMVRAAERFNLANDDKDPQYISQTFRYLQNKLFIAPRDPPKLTPDIYCPICKGSGISVNLETNRAKPCSCLHEVIENVASTN